MDHCNNMLQRTYQALSASGHFTSLLFAANPDKEPIRASHTVLLLAVPFLMLMQILEDHLERKCKQLRKVSFYLVGVLIRTNEDVQ